MRGPGHISSAQRIQEIAASLSQKNVTAFCVSRWNFKAGSGSLLRIYPPRRDLHDRWDEAVCFQP